MSDKVTFETLSCRDQNNIGCITLNNPSSLNALSLDMVQAMQTKLETWAKKKDIAFILVRAKGDKAFCAGGDVQAVYHVMHAELGKDSTEKDSLAKPNQADVFFTHEYRLDYTLHKYPKPIVVWGHGIVMGGGLGLFMGGDIRVVTEKSRVAMPEISIGLYPDVGASYFLNRLEGKAGRFMALTGAQLNARDCLDLGLANSFVQHSDASEIISLLREQTWSNNKREDSEVIRDVFDSFADDAEEKLPESNIDAHRDTIDAYFSEPKTTTLIDNFLAMKTRDPWLKQAQHTLQSGSPLSAHIIDEQLKRSKNVGLREVFQAELVLSCNIVRFTEFAEGIRARLIEKDNAPQWHFKDFHQVPEEFVARFFVAPWDTHPLQDL